MPRPRILTLVLAGGVGSRLEVLTDRRAKPALPYAGSFRLIDVPLSNALHSGLSDVWIIEQYQPHSLNEQLANGRPWDLDRTQGGLRVLPPYEGGDEDGFAEGNADDYVSELAHGMQSYRAEEDEYEAREGAETLGEAEAAADEGDAPGRVEAQGEATPDAVEEDADAPTDASEDAPRRHPHATFVVSAGLACWLGEERSFDPTEHLTGDPPTTGEAKRLHRPDTAS